LKQDSSASLRIFPLPQFAVSLDDVSEVRAMCSLHRRIICQLHDELHDSVAPFPCPDRLSASFALSHKLAGQ
jgi:hypothetical protein